MKAIPHLPFSYKISKSPSSGGMAVSHLRFSESAGPETRLDRLGVERAPTDQKPWHTALHIPSCNSRVNLWKNGVRRGKGQREADVCLLLTSGFVLRVPLRRHPSLRKKLRARGQLSEFWKSQNLDMIQFTETCTMDQSANEPLINYLDVRPPGAGTRGRGEGRKARPGARPVSGQQH